MELIDTEVVTRWTSVFRTTIAEAPSPCAEAATIDVALARDSKRSERLGMWLALLELPSPVEQQEALRGIARLVEEVASVRTATALMLVAHLSRDDLWLRNFAIAPSVRILMRLADLNPAVREEAVAYGRQLSEDEPRAAQLLVRHAALDSATVNLIVERLAMLDEGEMHPIQTSLEVRLRQQPDLFVPYIETVLRRFAAFSTAAREAFIERLVPMLNREVRRDFVMISPAAYERVGTAILEAPVLDEDQKRYLVWELVPHCRDLAARQTLAPPVRIALDDQDEKALDRVFSTARKMDPLAAAGFLLNVVRHLERSPMRFQFAERMVAEYSGYGPLRRAATIDFVGREMWRHLFRHHDSSVIELEGLAEASEPQLDTMEAELVEQIRGELQRMRLRSYPKV